LLPGWLLRDGLDAMPMDALLLNVNFHYLSSRRAANILGHAKLRELHQNVTNKELLWH